MNGFLKACIAGFGTAVFFTILSSYSDWLPEFVGSVMRTEGSQVIGLLVLGAVLGWFVPRHFLGLVAGALTPLVFSEIVVLFSTSEAGFFLPLALLSLTFFILPGVALVWIGWLVGRTAVLRVGLDGNIVNEVIGIAILVAAVASPFTWMIWDGRHRVPTDDFATVEHTRAPRRVTPAWTLRIGEKEVGAPVAIRGRVFATADHIFHAINSDGSGAWTLPKATTQPVLHDGRLYAGFETGLARIDPDSGATIWNADVPTGSYTINSWESRRRLSVGASGVIYVNPEQESIYAINPDGTLRWSFRHNGGVFIGAPIEAGEHVYVASQITRGRPAVCAIDTNGRLVWEHRFPGSLIGPVAVDRAEHVYVPVSEYLFSLAPDGSELWRRRFTFDRPGTPVIDPRDNVVTRYREWIVIAPDGRTRHMLGYGSRPLFEQELTIIAGEGLQVFGSDGTLVELLQPWPYESDGSGAEVALGPDAMIYLQFKRELVALPRPRSF